MITPIASPFIVDEGQLARELGVTREELRVARCKHLRERTDWVNPGRILLTESAASRLSDLLLQKIAPAKEPPVPATASQALVESQDTTLLVKNAPRPSSEANSAILASIVPTTGPQEMTVHRIGFRNWRVLEAKTAAGDVVVVATNAQTRESAAHFLPGMTISALLTDHGWQQVGRAPRWRGKY
jgi:hypothetical protein